MTCFNKANWCAAAILLAGFSSVLVMAGLKGEPQVTAAPCRPVFVEIMPVIKKDYRIGIPAWGIVQPAETIDIRPEIPGKVAHVSDHLFSGARVKKGEHLFSLDAREYKHALVKAKALAQQARQALEIEKGRQVIARSEWDLLENSKWKGSQNKALALRKPQLKEREAEVKMAAAQQGLAKLDVDRARLTAPCDGVILEESIAKGQYLDAGQAAVRMACTDQYSISALFLPKYSPDPDMDAVTIEIGPNPYKGKIKAILPGLHPETRHKQALVVFRGEGVFLNDYASLSLPGPGFEKVIVLPRQALRAKNTVWVMNPGNRLEIRIVTLVAKDKDNVVIATGLSPDDKVILSHIANPLQGMALRGESPAAQDPRNRTGNTGMDG